MIDKELTCPFCGGKVWIVAMDDEGNIHNDEYAEDPWSGLMYGLVHRSEDVPDGELCPIDGENIVGGYRYDSVNETVIAWTDGAESRKRPPVTVGDILWTNYKGDVFPVTVFEVKSIDKLDGQSLHKSRRIGVFGRRPRGNYTSIYRTHFNWNSIGKSLFYTEDEARARKRK